MKSGLAVGEGDLSVGQFTKEELRDLFTFQPNISCDTHNLLQCNCDGVGKVIKVEGEEEQVEERKCQLGRSTSTSGVDEPPTSNIPSIRHAYQRSYSHSRPTHLPSSSDILMTSSYGALNKDSKSNSQSKDIVNSKDSISKNPDSYSTVV